MHTLPEMRAAYSPGHAYHRLACWLRQHSIARKSSGNAAGARLRLLGRQHTNGEVDGGTFGRAVGAGIVHTADEDTNVAQ
jgi:hypothetical protein